MSDAAAPLLEVDGLYKSFGGLIAVNRVSLHLAAGEVLGIAGPNGSGKSTLFNLITRVPWGAERGRVRFAGRSIHRLAAHRIARLGLARTFQRETVFADLSAIDNVLVAVEQRPEAPGDFAGRVAEAEAALDQAGFPPTLHNTPAGGLPFYHRKQIMLAGALALKPRVLLLDEPASGLTPEEIRATRELILRLARRGFGILLIEHVLPLLVGVSDRLMVLDRGRVLAAGMPDRVIADPAVREAYLGGD